MLKFGIGASLLYVAADIIGALRWKDYRYASQSVSELMAVGAPSRPLVLPLFKAHDLLVIAFGVGVWNSAGHKRSLHVSGGALVGAGVVGFVTGLFFPMHMRERLGGAERELTDSMHLALTGALVVLIQVAVGSGAVAFDRRFRRYSIGTILTMLAGGAVTAAAARRVEAQLPTPWVGISERINIYSYLLWISMLATALLHREEERATLRPRWYRRR